MLVIKIMKELYDSISEYKDAQEKAQSCEQPLPENGSLKSGNGTSTDLTIKVPDQNESVFLKLYDADGNEIPVENGKFSFDIKPFEVKTFPGNFGF